MCIFVMNDKNFLEKCLEVLRCLKIGFWQQSQLKVTVICLESDEALAILTWYVSWGMKGASAFFPSSYHWPHPAGYMVSTCHTGADSENMLKTDFTNTVFNI